MAQKKVFELIFSSPALASGATSCRNQHKKAIAEKLISNWFSFIKCCCYGEEGNDKSFFMYPHQLSHFFPPAFTLLPLWWLRHFLPRKLCKKICFSLYYLMLSCSCFGGNFFLFISSSLDERKRDWALRISDHDELMCGRRMQKDET